MLTEIRDRSTGAFAWVIAALIIIPMAFWGVQEYAGTNDSPSIVTVGDVGISQAEFQSRLSQEQDYMRQVMGKQVNNSFLNSDNFKTDVLRKMMNRELINQIADEENYQIGDQQLANIIKSNEQFQKDGVFDQDAYNRYVAQTRYSKTQFEDQIRDQSRINQVTTGYAESSFALDSEVNSILELQVQQRTFDVVTVKQSDQLEGLTVDEAEIQEYYTNNQSQYMNPEFMSVSYVRLSTDDLLQEVEVTEDELRALYEDNLEAFTTGERRDARHILLKTSADSSASDIEAKREKALALIKQLKEGKDFAELAKANSEDPGSAQQGGGLGSIARGQMVPEFEDATFKLAENEISEPIKSQFGFHIIEVKKIEASVQKPFEEVRFDLEQDERERLAEELLLERVDQLRDLSYEQPDNLDYAADQLSLKIQESDLFDRANGTAIAASEQLREMAFSEDVLADGNNSTPIELSEGEYVVIRKSQHKAAAPKPLSEVSATISATLKKDKATKLAEEKGQALLAKAQQDWASVASDKALKVENFTVAFADQSRSVNADILAHVNTLHVADDKPVVTSVSDSLGDYHVIQLTNVEAGDVSKVSEQVKDNARLMLERRNGNPLFGSYLESLIDEQQLQINSDLL